MSFLEEPGDLAEVPLAAVLLEVLNGRESGVLSVAHGRGSSRLYFRQGMPVGAQSFASFHPLGKVLLEEGLIDLPTLDRGLAEMARTGRLQGEVLVDLGAVTREQVARALAEQQGAYLRAISWLASGRFSFDRGAPIPEWTRAVRIAPLQAIVETLEGPQAMPLVVSALQPAAGFPLALSPDYARLAPAFGWSAGESSLVARVDGYRSLDDLLAEAPLEPARARAVVAALLLLGLAGRRPEGEEGEEEAVVELTDLLGLESEEAPAETPPSVNRATPAQAPPLPGRRSDPAEARRRRQRLLQRAMQNMGIGPFSGQPRPAASDADEATPVPSARPPAPPATGEGERARKARTVPADRGERAHGTPAGKATEGAGAVQAELRRALSAVLPRAQAADLFERLGVARSATREEVKRAWLQLARTLHPDRFAAPGLADLAPQVKSLFAAVNEAYEVLSDDRKRAEYLARPAPGSGPSAADAASAAVDFQKAEACLRTRDFPRARAFYEAALRADRRPAYELGYAAALQQDPRGDRARALALATSAARDPGSAGRASLLLGVLAREAGDDEAAVKHLRRALALDPHSADARRELDGAERRLVARDGAAPAPRSGRDGLFRRR